jgi:hypothetical protein
MDPFDKLLDNHDHIDDLLSDPEVIAIIQNHLLAIADTLHPELDVKDGLQVHALQSKLVTPEELALGSFTRQKLKTLSTWSGASGWLTAEKKQLNQFHNIDMFGPPGRTPWDATILRHHWNYRMKTNGTRCARQCCDGSKQAAPHLHAETDTYTSSLEHPMWHLFVSLCVPHHLTMHGGDVKDAHTHAPGPTKPPVCVGTRPELNGGLPKLTNESPRIKSPKFFVPCKDILKLAMPGNVNRCWLDESKPPPWSGCCCDQRLSNSLQQPRPLINPIFFLGGSAASSLSAVSNSTMGNSCYRACSSRLLCQLDFCCEPIDY